MVEAHHNGYSRCAALVTQCRDIVRFGQLHPIQLLQNYVSYEALQD